MASIKQKFRIVVAGGAGAMGQITVRDLVEFFPEAEVLIADYDKTKAERLAISLKTPRAIFIDVTKQETLQEALKGAFLVINCCPYQFNVAVMEAALIARCHYIDLGGLFHITKLQLKYHLRFKAAGLLAVLGMGASPGITNLLAAEAVLQLDEVSEIHIRLGSHDATKYDHIPALPVSYSLKTILEEFSKPPAVFTKGKLTFIEPMSGADPYRFPAPVGMRRPFFTLHSEIATLPQSFRDKGVREVSFKIAFNDDFVNKVRFLRDLGLASAEPLDIRGTKIAPILVVDRVAMSQKPSHRIGLFKQHEILRAIVKGIRNGKKRTVLVDCHTIGIPKWGLGSDVNTGCPPAIAAKFIADERTAVRGALPPEKTFNPSLFFEHLKPRGMTIRKTEISGWSEKT